MNNILITFPLQSALDHDGIAGRIAGKTKSKLSWFSQLLSNTVKQTRVSVDIYCSKFLVRHFANRQYWIRLVERHRHRSASHFLLFPNKDEHQKGILSKAQLSVNFSHYRTFSVILGYFQLISVDFSHFQSSSACFNLGWSPIHVFAPQNDFGQKLLGKLKRSPKFWKHLWVISQIVGNNVATILQLFNLIFLFHLFSIIGQS